MMATVNLINNSNNTTDRLKATIEYVTQEYKTILDGVQYVAGIGCDAKNAYSSMMGVKKDFGKADGRAFYHITQSFDPDEKITPQQAQDIALELAQYFNGHQVLVATHIERDHLHSHLVVNSVNYNTGKKLHCPKDMLFLLRQLSDKICLAHGLSTLAPVTQEQNDISMNPREYRSAMKGNSWKFRLIHAIDDARQRSHNKQEFIRNMEYEGISVKWVPERKNITYTMPDGQKCRDDNLHDSRYLKDNMEEYFSLRESGLEQTADNISTAPTASEFVGTMDNALRLLKDIENIGDHSKSHVKPIASDRRLRWQEKIKKLASGHKLRDEEESLDYSIKR